MDETGPGPSTQPVVGTLGKEMESLQRAVAAAAGEKGASTIAGGISSVRLEAEIQHLSERLRTLESGHNFVRSDSAPSPSSGHSRHRQLPPPTSAGFVFATGSSSSSPPPLRHSAVPTENGNMQMRKLDLCYRKAESYEGMAMVLNVSFDRLLNQVTEIDNQRRRENEARDAQERKIQVNI